MSLSQATLLVPNPESHVLQGSTVGAPGPGPHVFQACSLQGGHVRKPVSHRPMGLEHRRVRVLGAPGGPWP